MGTRYTGYVPSTHQQPIVGKEGAQTHVSVEQRTAGSQSVYSSVCHSDYKDRPGSTLIRNTSGSVYADTFKPVRPGALPRQGKAISKKPAEDAPPVPKFTHKTTKQCSTDAVGEFTLRRELPVEQRFNKTRQRSVNSTASASEKVKFRNSSHFSSCYNAEFGRLGDNPLDRLPSEKGDFSTCSTNRDLAMGTSKTSDAALPGATIHVPIADRNRRCVHGMEHDEAKKHYKDNLSMCMTVNKSGYTGHVPQCPKNPCGERQPDRRLTTCGTSFIEHPREESSVHARNNAMSQQFFKGAPNISAAEKFYTTYPRPMEGLWRIGFPDERRYIKDSDLKRNFMFSQF